GDHRLDRGAHVVAAVRGAGVLQDGSDALHPDRRGVLMTEPSEVRVERRLFDGSGVAIWTIDREARMNALSRAVVRELGRLAHEASADRTLRAVVITGAGEK